MPISVSCECGKTYRVADNLVGRRAKCKACGRLISIEVPKNDAPLDDLLGDLPSESSAPRVGITDSPLAPKRIKKRVDRTAMYAVGGASGLVLLLAIVSAIVFWPASDRTNVSLPGTDDDRIDANSNETSTSSLTADPSAAAPESNLESDSPPPGDSSSHSNNGDQVSNGGASVSAPAPESDIEMDARRDFPSLPRALTEVPSWLDDDDPLFDYAKFFAAPPPGQNGAKLYLDALFEFYPPSENSLDLVFNVEDTKRRIEEVSRRGEQFEAFVARHGSDLQRLSWWLENEEDVTSFLEPFRTGIEKLSAAQELESCVFETELTFLPSVSFPNAVIRAGEVLTFHALSAIGQRSFDDTYERLRQLLRLVRDVRRRGQPTMQRIAYQLEQKCLRTIVPPLLALPGLGAEQYDRVLNLITEHERETVDGFIEGSKADYITARKALHDFRHRVGQFRPVYMERRLESDLPVENAAACLNYVLGARYFASGVAFRQWRWSELDAVGRSAKFNEFDATANALTAEDYAQERAALNRCFAAILDPGEAARIDHYATLDTATEVLAGTTIAMFLEPKIDDIPLRDLHSRALIRGTKCITAVYRWYADEKNHPDDWEAALSAAGIDAIPGDPFADGEPLQFVRNNNTSIVYSIGPDRKDGDGRKTWYGNPRRLAGDITFRCQVHSAD